MLLLLRDEDVPTVASAITAIALQNGLEPVDTAEQNDLFAIAAVLTGPRVTLAAGEEFVIADGLATLAIGDVDEWGTKLSAACGNEVIGIAPGSDGISVHVFDDGDVEEVIPILLDPSGVTRAPALAEIVPTEEAAAAWEKGIAALNAVELSEHVLRSFGATPPSFYDHTDVLAFARPGDDDDGMVVDEEFPS